MKNPFKTIITEEIIGIDVKRITLGILMIDKSIHNVTIDGKVKVINNNYEDAYLYTNDAHSKCNDVAHLRNIEVDSGKIVNGTYFLTLTKENVQPLIKRFKKITIKKFLRSEVVTYVSLD